MPQRLAVAVLRLGGPWCASPPAGSGVAAGWRLLKQHAGRSWPRWLGPRSASWSPVVNQALSTAVERDLDELNAVDPLAERDSAWDRRSVET